VQCMRRTVCGHFGYYSRATTQSICLPHRDIATRSPARPDPVGGNPAGRNKVQHVIRQPSSPKPSSINYEEGGNREPKWTYHEAIQQPEAQFDLLQ